MTLEEPFWRAFKALALHRGLSINALATAIDTTRPTEVGLASALRLHVLDALLNEEREALLKAMSAA